MKSQDDPTKLRQTMQFKVDDTGLLIPLPKKQRPGGALEELTKPQGFTQGIKFKVQQFVDRLRA